jgi:predicted transcriptional regulator
MELETMFTEQKWNIIKCLSNEKYSTLQLAQNLNTTMANISQQLRLLQAANLVKKEKIKNRDKGKPRSLFSLTDDYAYLVSSMKRFADKKLLKVTDHHRAILKIWFIGNEQLQYETEKLYWKLEPYTTQISAIAVNEKTGGIYIISEKTREMERIVKYEKAKVISKTDAEKLVHQGNPPLITDLTVIYDPTDLLVKK